MSRVRVPSATPQAGRHFRLPAFYASFAVRKQLSEDLLDLARCHRGGGPADDGDLLHRIVPRLESGATRCGPCADCATLSPATMASIVLQRHWPRPSVTGT